MRMRVGVAQWVTLSLRLVGALWLVSVPPYGHAEPSSVKGAIALFAEREHNFGTVPQGAKVTHEFEIENRGAVDLLIERLTPSCGCTATTVSASSVKPASKEKIRVEFDSAGFSGPKVKTVEVVTNDPDNRKVLLTLKGTVLPGIVAHPSRLEFGAISPGRGGEERVKRFEVDLNEGETGGTEGCNVRSFSRYLLARPAEGKEGGMPAFEVEIAADAPKGEFRDRILVECAGDRRQPLSVPVTAFVQGDLRLKPGVLAFGVISGTQLLEKKAVLENSSREEIVVEQVVASHEAVKASYVKGSRSQGARREAGVVVVSVDPTKVKGPLQATVTLSTTHPVDKEVVITVTGVTPP